MDKKSEASVSSKEVIEEPKHQQSDELDQSLSSSSSDHQKNEPLEHHEETIDHKDETSDHDNLNQSMTSFKDEQLEHRDDIDNQSESSKHNDEPIHEDFDKHSGIS